MGASDRGFPMSRLREFLARYGTEEQCIEALARWRWPKGFSCPKCHHDRYYRVTSRLVRQCTRCRCQHSATAGTILDSTRLPISTWFRGLYLVEYGERERTPVRTLQRKLGISYNAASRMKRKLLTLINDEVHPLRLALPEHDVHPSRVETGD